MDSLHIRSPHRISAIICVYGVLEILQKKMVCMQRMDELSSKNFVKADGTAMFYFVWVRHSPPAASLSTCRCVVLVVLI